MDRSGWSRTDYQAWAMRHIDKVKICAEENYVKCGRGVVTLLFKGEDVHITFIPAAQVPLHGVGKFEVGLKGMIASYDPDHHATIMILEGPKIIGCGMVEIG